MADWVIVAVSDDAEQAREDAKRQIAFHATVRTYDRILELHGFDAVAAQIRELWRSFDLAGMTALVTDEMLDEMAVAGAAADCRTALQKREAAADRLLLGAPVVATDPDRIRDYPTSTRSLSGVTFGGPLGPRVLHFRCRRSTALTAH